MYVTSPVYSFKAWQQMGSEALYSMFGWQGSNIFQRRNGKTIIMRNYSPTNPNSQSQQKWRGSFGDAVSLWQAMSDSEKASWNDYQNNRRRRPVMSGYNLFISKYLLTNGNPKIPNQG